MGTTPETRLGGAVSLLARVQGTEKLFLSGRRNVMPGGFGTLDEAFELMTLVQTGKLERFPTVTMGGAFWEHLREFIRRPMIAEGTIDAGDLELARPAATPEDAVRLIREAHRETP